MWVLILLALAGAFVSYLIYSRQTKWFVGVARNSVCGIGGLLLFNFAFPSIAVGINAVTVLIVGVLGVPGFFLLYATRLLV
jgi:hypothetical protein